MDKWRVQPGRNRWFIATSAKDDKPVAVADLDCNRVATLELLADANLGAEACTAAGNFPGTPAELIEQLKRELDNALQREQALRYTLNSRRDLSDLDASNLECGPGLPDNLR